MSGDIFIETENENPDKAAANDSNSEASLKFYTPKNTSNISKFMQDIIYDMDEMEFTQTLPSKEITVDTKLKDKEATENSPIILSNDDEDIIESTPKSNKSASRVKSLKDALSPLKVFSQQLRSQKRTIELESEVSEHPSIILGTEYTQKVTKQLKLKKRSLSDHNEENKLDVTLIEPIETQTPNSIPVLVDLPPPTEFMDTEEEDNQDKSKRNNLNNFSALPEATILKNMKTPVADINIQRLKDGPILTEIPENGPVTSIESVIEQTPLSCYPPKSRINLSNTKAFKQISRKVSTSDSEPEENPLEVVKDNTPRRLYNGPSSSKQLSILSYVNGSQERQRKLSESQVNASQDRQRKLSESQVSIKSQSTGKKLSTSIRMNPPSLPVNMSSSQRKSDGMNDSFKSQFDTPTTQSFARPMASSTPARPGIKSVALNRFRTQRSMEIFWTRLSISQINLLMDFCKQFNIKYTTDNTDTTTHLITRVDENNFVEDYTLKYVCAVARGIWVLSFKWIEDSLDSNKILPEEPFEVLDTTGNLGPRMSRLRERSSILLEKFAVCVVSSPATFPKDKLINCILQNGGKIYDTVEDLASACQDGKIRLIITDTPETQDAITFQDYFERYGILSIVTEWLFNTIAIFKVESLVSYLVCTVTDVVPEEYPQELLIESEVLCDSTFDR
ncbi:microcephalin-like [Chrysoperla carnea]|uniref:microcephalin-like n=1 Tax=Chrysoperla carnea TaxID=189513 RepID=UPI001D098E1F|nr:microcephalin-like [Chrysoperla carnea]